TAPAPGAPDWAQILALYDQLIAIWPSPIVALNRAIAVGEAHGPAAGLAALDTLAAEPQLAGYHYLPAARAEYLRRLDPHAGARRAPAPPPPPGRPPPPTPSSPPPAAPSSRTPPDPRAGLPRNNARWGRDSAHLTGLHLRYSSGCRGLWYVPARVVRGRAGA